MSSENPAEAAKPSLEAVFETEEAALLRYAYGLVGHRQLAEELVQDAFLRLHEHWDTVEKPRPCLYRCVQSQAVRHLRDRGENSGNPSRSGERTPAGLNGSRELAAPDEILGRQGVAAGLVRMMLDEMTERDRELIQLKYSEDLQFRGISERTGMSIGKVGYRFHHILKSLADSLRQPQREGGER